jgi:hypothetical protein
MPASGCNPNRSTRRHPNGSGPRRRVDNDEAVKTRVVLLAILVALGACQVTSAAATGSTATISVDSPCGVTKGAPSYTHVVWILLENEGYSVVGSPNAPYLNRLTQSCALAVNDVAISHPSLPNYIALTSGSTHGISDDGEPSIHPLVGASIFSQLDGKWRALVQSMPEACDHVTSGSYAARHNPAVYYLSLASTCRRDDIPLTFPMNLSAPFTFITPNICDDMHSCPVNIGDRWLSRIVPEIIESPQYQSQSLALFITFDENDGGANNRVPTYVIAPSVPKGTRVATAFTHYSLLRTTEQLLHLPFLGKAQRAASMLNPFHL